MCIHSFVIIAVCDIGNAGAQAEDHDMCVSQFKITTLCRPCDVCNTQENVGFFPHDDVRNKFKYISLFYVCNVL